MKLFFAAAVAVAAIAAPARATLVTFDDLPGNFPAIANGYNGLDWSNFVTVAGANTPLSGYPAAVVSAPIVALNSYGLAASISSASAFRLTSAYLTAAWNVGLTVRVDGTLGGNPVYTQYLNPSVLSSTQFIFNSAPVDSVAFLSYGGTPHPPYEITGAGEQFIMDNLQFTLGAGPIPEPASWALMVTGFGLVGATLRRRSAALT